MTGTLHFLIYAAWTVAPLLAVAASGATAQEHCFASRYEVHLLPLRAAAINDSALVVGTTETHHAALWSSAGGLRELPIPDGYQDSDGVAINAAGTAVGNAHIRSAGRQAAFMVAHGVLHELPGFQARVYALNAGGAAAGTAASAAGATAGPVTWARAGRESVPTCCGGTATGIDAAGDLIGDLYDDQGRYHAFLWTRAGGIRLIGPSGNYSSAIAINQRAHVVIQAFSKVFLYRSGSLSQLELHPKFPSKPLAINNCDAIVGAFGPFSDADRAFLWHESIGFRDLNALIPENSGWTLEAATGINEHGLIVGKGEYLGKEDQGFLLVPLE